MSNRIITNILVFILAITFLSACGKKKEEVTSIPEPQDVEVVEETPVPSPLAEAIAPKVNEEEAKVIASEQKKVAAEAKKQEIQAEREVAKKVVTSSVAESAPIPDGFPVQNVPIIQGAQIVSASKNGNTYNMVLRVNVSASDAYKHYFDLYDSLGSVKINSKSENTSLSIERSKSGLKADFSFADENEKSSTVTITVVEN